MLYGFDGSRLRLLCKVFKMRKVLMLSVIVAVTMRIAVSAAQAAQPHRACKPGDADAANLQKVTPGYSRFSFVAHSHSSSSNVNVNWISVLEAVVYAVNNMRFSRI